MDAIGPLVVAAVMVTVFLAGVGAGHWWAWREVAQFAQQAEAHGGTLREVGRRMAEQQEATKSENGGCVGGAQMVFWALMAWVVMWLPRRDKS